MTRLLPLLLALALLACGSSAPPVGAPVSPAAPNVSREAPIVSPDAGIVSTWTPPLPSKATGCLPRGPLPDPACTPGAVESRDLAVICGQGTRERRRVSAATHRAIYAAYGAASPAPAGTYEVDHLVPLELGGSNDPANLWLEPEDPVPGFHQKDRLENALHREVCAGRMGIAEAQRAIAEDWVGAAKRMGVGP